MGTMMRLDGWEASLNSILEAASLRPYVIGEWDCFKMACDVIAAITGRPNPWPEWKGRYHDERSAVDLLHQRGGFMRAFSDGFGSEPVSPRLAQRGDICAYRDEERIFHLGVCVGDKVALLSENGLVFVAIAQCKAAWRID